MTWFAIAIGLPIWLAMIVVVLLFFRGARAVSEDLPGPQPAEPTAEDIEWARAKVFAEIDRRAAQE